MNVIHKTEIIPNLIRTETYQWNNFKYIERFDELTGLRMWGTVKIYDQIDLCSVNEDGTILMTTQLDWVTRKSDLQRFIKEMTDLDKFLAIINNNYEKQRSES